MPTFAVATPHALILTVSHGLLFCQPPSFTAAQVPPVLSETLGLTPDALKQANSPMAETHICPSRHQPPHSLTIVLIRLTVGPDESHFALAPAILPRC
jgi:hypothetical protein